MGGAFVWVCRAGSRLTSVRPGSSLLQRPVDGPLEIGEGREPVLVEVRPALDELEEFADDAKDAGDVGAGHSVTAFYELVPPGEGAPGADLTYQDVRTGTSTDFFTVHVRYKQPGAAESTEVVVAAGADAWTDRPSADFLFASAVAEFGLAVTRSEHAGDADPRRARGRAAAALGEDRYGLRAEFVELVDRYQEIAA